jgi:hypothetical protein
MLASGDRLVGGKGEGAGTCSFCVIGQINLLVFTRAVATSRAHVFQRIRICVVVSHWFEPGLRRIRFQCHSRCRERVRNTERQALPATTPASLFGKQRRRSR